MTSENLNIVLTNAVCCISEKASKVSKLYSIGDKCADSELQKLKLMNDWFEVLKCYNIEKINSYFSLRFTSDEFNDGFLTISNPLRTYRIIVNDAEYTLQGDGVLTKEEIFYNIISTISNIVSYTVEGKGKGFVYMNIEAECDVTSIIFDTTMSTSNFIFTNIKNGICTVKNCLSEDDFNIIVAKLMKECDICECQLNQ